MHQAPRRGSSAPGWLPTQSAREGPGLDPERTRHEARPYEARPVHALLQAIFEKRQDEGRHMLLKHLLRVGIHPELTPTKPALELSAESNPTSHTRIRR